MLRVHFEQFGHAATKVGKFGYLGNLLILFEDHTSVAAASACSFCQSSWISGGFASQ